MCGELMIRRNSKQVIIAYVQPRMLRTPLFQTLWDIKGMMDMVRGEV